MARVPYFDPVKATGRAAELYRRLPDLNVFRMLGHNAEMFDAFVKMGNAILARGQLDPVLREIAIIRAGVLCKAAYEVQQHEAIGRRLGMNAALLAAIHQGPEAAAFNDLQRAVMAFTDDVVLNVRAGDATFVPLLESLGLAQLQELTIAIGYYMMVSRFLETFGVDLEAEPEGKSLNLPGLKP